MISIIFYETRMKNRVVTTGQWSHTFIYTHKRKRKKGELG